MSQARRFLALATLLATVALTVALGSPLPAASADAPPQAASGPETGTAVEYAVSPPVSQLPAATVGSAGTFNPPRINPLANEPDGGQRGTWNRPSIPADPLIDPSAAPGVHTPALNLSFEGVGNPLACNGCTPPDTNGDVGPNHYIQMVNATKVAIFDKAGNALAAPFDLGTLWPGGATCASNIGDPIVLYDPLADRWLLSQFANPTHLCFAISQTANPLGTYHLFTFNVGSFPDYFKVGVWPDAYYVGANESTYTAYAFNRAKMLAGDMTANFVKFPGQTNFLLPADLDGPTAPPMGSPGLFYTFKDNAFHGGGGDRIEVFALVANFTTPASSTFTMTASLPIASFTYTVCGFFNLNCARQLGTATRLDVVSEWPMHRFPYRNFGTHQTLLGNFTVGGGTGNVGAAIRWFELRNTGGGWTLFQEGTHDPGDGHDRFMGSIAMDAAGNIALGYSVSSNTMNPAIRYTTRAPGDPAGTMQAEAVLINGAGSQTGSNRWGDYSAMSVDPADDCTFWYTNEYYPVSATTTWKTRVGNFRYPGCVSPLTLQSLTANPPSPQPPGTTITFTATGTGGTPPYQYKFWLSPDAGVTWIVVRDWGASNMFTWGPNAPTSTTLIGVWLRSAGNTNDMFEAGGSIPFVVGGATLQSLTANPPSPQPQFTTIVFTATGTGGTPPYQFKFWLSLDAGATWIVVRDWGASNMFTYGPTAANANTMVGVWLRSAGNTNDMFEGGGAIPFVVTPRASLQSLTANPPSPQPVFTTIVFTATGTGGTPPYQFRFWLSPDAGATWFVVQDWGASNMFTYGPTAANANTMVGVWLRSQGNTSDMFEGGGAIPFVVTP